MATSTSEYALKRIAMHRVCRNYGWDPEVVWGFAKGIMLMQESVVAGKTCMRLGNGGNVSTAKRAASSRQEKALRGQ